MASMDRENYLAILTSLLGKAQKLSRDVHILLDMIADSSGLPTPDYASTREWTQVHEVAKCVGAVNGQLANLISERPSMLANVLSEGHDYELAGHLIEALKEGNYL